MTPSRGEAWGRALLVLASLLVSFLAAEAAFSVIPLPTGNVLNVYNRRMTAGLDCYPSDPRGEFDLDLRDRATQERFETLGVRHVEQCAEYAPHAVELRYNSMQLRDREPSPRKPGVRRVVVLGDSFTEGQGVKEERIYPRVLEAALNASGPGWEVLNFGRRGADFPALENTFEESLAHEPDVVVYGMLLNDCETSDDFRARHPFVTGLLEGPRRKLVLMSGRPPFGERTALFVRRRVDQYRLDRAMRAWYADLYGEANVEGWRRTQAAIERMHRRMALRGGHLLVATWPVLAHLDRDYPFQDAHETVGRFCHASGIAWMDLLPALEGQAAEDLWVHPHDPHPNASAHGLVAQALAPALRRLATGL
jgi:lysophospholipase L1-like esterase